MNEPEAMTTDEDLIATRKLADTRRFLIGATDPTRAPILGPALIAVRALLLDGQWHTYAQVVGAALRASPDVSVSTMASKLWELHKSGIVERRGDYISSRKHVGERDSREYRLVDWPAAS
jgi:hypothetical protein